MKSSIMVCQHLLWGITISKGIQQVSSGCSDAIWAIGISYKGVECMSAEQREGPLVGIGYSSHRRNSGVAVGSRVQQGNLITHK